MVRAGRGKHLGLEARESRAPGVIQPEGKRRNEAPKLFRDIEQRTLGRLGAHALPRGNERRQLAHRLRFDHRSSGRALETNERFEVFRIAEVAGFGPLDQGTFDEDLRIREGREDAIERAGFEGKQGAQLLKGAWAVESDELGEQLHGIPRIVSVSRSAGRTE